MKGSAVPVRFFWAAGRSYLAFSWSVTTDREVLTIEGLSEGGESHPLQAEMTARGGIQCGYCTPGIIMSAYALLQENPRPSEDEIRFAIAGNLCRCTGYSKIVEAIQAAAGTPMR